MNVWTDNLFFPEYVHPGMKPCYDVSGCSSTVKNGHRNWSATVAVLTESGKVRYATKEERRVDISMHHNTNRAAVARMAALVLSEWSLSFKPVRGGWEDAVTRLESYDVRWFSTAASPATIIAAGRWKRAILSPDSWTAVPGLADGYILFLPEPAFVGRVMYRDREFGICSWAPMAVLNAPFPVREAHKKAGWLEYEQGTLAHEVMTT